MFLGYNTNGFAHHRLDDTIAILADLGYNAIGITVDHQVLNPFDDDWRHEADRVRTLLDVHHLRCVIETGSRFLLDPRRKHQPTLLSATEIDRNVRYHFLEHCVELASLLGADALSFWSGTADDVADTETLLGRLVDGCRLLIEAAEKRSVRLAFEPEPGMFIDTMAQYSKLLAKLRETVYPATLQGTFGTTIDVNHLQCLEKPPFSQSLCDWNCVQAGGIANIHLSDGRTGVHDHLLFGEGEIDFADFFKGLKSVGYSGGVYVELSRHSHDAVRAAERSRAFLAHLMDSV